MSTPDQRDAITRYLAELNKAISNPDYGARHEAMVLLGHLHGEAIASIGLHKANDVNYLPLNCADANWLRSIGISPE